jgi:uncharacterized protein
LLWGDRWLFEYWAHAASIVLTEDYPIHQVMMRDYTETVLSPQRRAWMAANTDFRRYILDTLRDSGPLPIDAFEDRAAVGWVSTGWTNGRNVEKMLDTLLKQGAITVAGRDGLKRLWGLADFPDLGEPLPQAEAVNRAAGQSLRALGVGRARDVELHFVPGRYAGRPRACGLGPASARRGRNEQWWVHQDTLGLLEEEWQPRTTLLSPFDNCICDRERTERLWGFAYRNEMYVPEHKRQFGCYVMPVLSGKRLIGRVASRVDRRRRVFDVEAMFAEAGAPADPLVPAAIEALASFAGADSVHYSGAVAFGVS